MKKTIEDIEMIKSIEVGENYIFIDKNIFIILKTFSNIKKPETEIEKYIKEKIKNSLNRNDITCQKLSSSYLNETGKFICKSSIHNILKNNLGYNFLKTTYKNNFLQTNEGIILSLIFIKVIVRTIKLGFEL